MKHWNEKGIAHLGVIIAVVVVVAAVAYGGWYVWDKKKTNGPQTNQAQSETESQVDETTDWVSVTVQGGAFSMRVPDGWKLTKYPDNFLGSMSVIYSPGTRAVIESSDAEYAGHSLSFRASVTPMDDAGLGPQWTSPQPGLEETTEIFSVGSLQGKRYKGVFTQDLNQILYEYVFALEGDRKLDIAYTVDHGKGDKDDVFIVEKAIKTIQLN